MKGYIYIVTKSAQVPANRGKEIGKYKVGRTTNPDDRFTAYGINRIVHYLGYTVNCVETEREFISRLKADSRFRLCEGHETFEGNLKNMTEVAKQCIADCTRNQIGVLSDGVKDILKILPNSYEKDKLTINFNSLFTQLSEMFEATIPKPEPVILTEKFAMYFHPKGKVDQYISLLLEHFSEYNVLESDISCKDTFQDPWVLVTIEREDMKLDWKSCYPHYMALVRKLPHDSDRECEDRTHLLPAWKESGGKIEWDHW